MLNLLLYALTSIFAYIFTLPGIIYANEKPTKIRRAILVLIIVAVGLLNGLVLKLKENTIPVDEVEKAWSEYEEYCKQEPEEELTFPEWLGIEASRP